MLALLTSVVKAETGWIRQTPALEDRLRPIHGLITDANIERARADWNGASMRCTATAANA